MPKYIVRIPVKATVGGVVEAETETDAIKHFTKMNIGIEASIDGEVSEDYTTLQVEDYNLYRNDAEAELVED